MNRKLLTLIAVITILAFTVTPASAYSPDQVSITSPMSISAGQGTFEATGAAVEAGLICPRGAVYDTLKRATAFQSGVIVNLFIRKLFVCSDGSGSFEMDLNVHLMNTPYLAFTQWVIVSGEGPYQRLRGNGSIYADKLDDDNLIDHYTGKLHID